MMEHRQDALQKWLVDTCGLVEPVLYAMRNDASFRRYFRIQQQGNSYVAMDAPPEKENCVPYVAISHALRAQGLLTPNIIAQDVAQGFLLLTDFGDSLLLHQLEIANAQLLYTQALDALAILKECCEVPAWEIKSFSADFMYQELKLFQEWFLQSYLDLVLSSKTKKMLEDFFEFLANSAATQPQVFIHRDYHSANLMLLPDNKIGILDFQDACIGPVTYDLVSLLRDCYIAWPEKLVTKLALQYKDQLDLQVGDREFMRWFDLMGLQRHLKALFIFARKYKRDNNANYLQHIPRTLNYIAQESRFYPQCHAFNRWLHEAIMPCVA
jgi:aminoglycoside/choline kinase family phosphotransferase